MLICETCHTERQGRKALESQPLQWTEYKAKMTTINCPDCSHKRNGLFYEYLNAYELVCELVEAREKLTKYDRDAPTFPGLYHNAADMLQALRLQNRCSEELEQVLQYAAELEGVLGL